MKPGSEVIEVNLEERAALLERARQEPLGEADYQRLQGAIEALNPHRNDRGEKHHDQPLACAVSETEHGEDP